MHTTFIFGLLALCSTTGAGVHANSSSPSSDACIYCTTSNSLSTNFYMKGPRHSLLGWNTLSGILNQSSRHTEKIQIKGSWQAYQAMSVPSLKRTYTPKQVHNIVKNLQSSATTDERPIMGSRPHISYRMAHLIFRESNEAKNNTRHQIPFRIHFKAALEPTGLSSVH